MYPLHNLGGTPMHEKHVFFKYYTCASAKLTLESGSRKWSTPFLFNDPFDNQFDLDFHDPTAELVRHQTDQFIALLRSTEPFKPDRFASQNIYVMMEFLRQVHQANPDFRYTADDIAYVDGGTLEGMQNIKKIAPEMSAEIRRVLADTTIFCVSETHDNILMWSHYAASATDQLRDLRDDGKPIHRRFAAREPLPSLPLTQGGAWPHPQLCGGQRRSHSHTGSTRSAGGSVGGFSGDCL